MSEYTAARTAMVDCQVRPSDVTKYPIIDALLTIKRETFVPKNKASVAYAGEHISLGAGRYLLDARTFGKLLDAVNIQPDDMVLDIGCGMGYSAAVIATMASVVVGVESDEDLAEQAAKNLIDQDIDNALVIHGDLASGHKKHAPYDVVIFEGSIETLPASIADQVKEGGRLAAIFMNDGVGQCRIGHKSGDTISWKNAFDATAPMIPGFEQEQPFTFA